MDVCSVVPGRVIEICVSPGDSVVQGDDLVVIESMKMEVPVQAPTSGRIEAVTVSLGDAVSDGTNLVVLV